MNFADTKSRLMHDRCMPSGLCPGEHDEPRQTTHGLQVCGTCETAVRNGLRDLPGLWDELAVKPTTGIRSGRQDDGQPQPLGDEQRRARSAIRACLVSWCLVLHEEETWKLALPEDTIEAMAHLIGVQAGRLLASEHADQLLADVTSLVREARRRTYRGRGHAVRVQCPGPVGGEPCGSWVGIDPDEQAENVCRMCGATGTTSWWIGLARPQQLLTISELPAALLPMGLRTTVKAVQHAADRGDLIPIALGTRNARLFDPVAAYAVLSATRRRVPA
jgi:hypothetical protein